MRSPSICSIRKGLSLEEAAIEAGRVRFLPILASSFAFIVGLLPLVFATGLLATGNLTVGAGATNLTYECL